MCPHSIETGRCPNMGNGGRCRLGYHLKSTASQHNPSVSVGNNGNANRDFNNGGVSNNRLNINCERSA